MRPFATASTSDVNSWVADSTSCFRSSFRSPCASLICLRSSSMAFRFSSTPSAVAVATVSPARSSICCLQISAGVTHLCLRLLLVRLSAPARRCRDQEEHGDEDTGAQQPPARRRRLFRSVFASHAPHSPARSHSVGHPHGMNLTRAGCRPREASGGVSRTAPAPGRLSTSPRRAPPARWRCARPPRSAGRRA